MVLILKVKKRTIEKLCINEVEEKGQQRHQTIGRECESRRRRKWGMEWSRGKGEGRTQQGREGRKQEGEARGEREVIGTVPVKNWSQVLVPGTGLRYYCRRLADFLHKTYGKSQFVWFMLVYTIYSSTFSYINLCKTEKKLVHYILLVIRVCDYVGWHLVCKNFLQYYVYLWQWYLWLSDVCWMVTMPWHNTYETTL